MAKQLGFYGGTSGANGSFPESKPATPNLTGKAVRSATRTNFPSPQVHKGPHAVYPHKVNK